MPDASEMNYGDQEDLKEVISDDEDDQTGEELQASLIRINTQEFRGFT